MKRNIFLVFSIFLITLLSSNKIQAQINPTSTPETEDKIVINVTIDIGPQGPLAYSVNVIQFPNTLTTNDPLPLEVHYENNTPIIYYLHIDHLGSTIAIDNQTSGATKPIPIPADDEDETPSGIIEDELPQPVSRYLFGIGNHKLAFRLLDTDDEVLGSFAQDQIDFSIYLSSDTSYLGDQANHTLVYPNPFIQGVTFDLINTKYQLKNKIVTITLYDQKGIIRDQIRENLSNNSKIEYSNITLPKGRYYYTITSNKGQKIDTGILLKQ